MNSETLTLTPEKARRLFIAKQHLAGDAIKGDFKGQITALIKDLSYIQWDPVTVVAPSHLISIWSRLGHFNWSDLDKIMWEEKNAFLHWTPIAVLVLTEDYPLFYTLMKGYPKSLGRWWKSHIKDAEDFIGNHRKLSEEVVRKLKEGPAEIKQFKGIGARRKSEDGWSSGNEVTTMLHHLHMMGQVMVSGHAGNQNLWSLTDQFLPQWAERNELDWDELEQQTAQKSIRALGIAPAFDIVRYFVRGRYWNLENTLKDLESGSRIIKVKIEGEKRGKQSYIHADDIPLVDSIDSGKYDSPMKLLSPFDNLITIRERARRMFNFDYILEQFVPKEKRKYGTYVLPVLWKDRLVGRIDAKLDKENKVLRINSVHAEQGFESDREIPDHLGITIDDFARFLDAEKVEYGRQMPDGWGRYLN